MRRGTMSPRTEPTEKRITYTFLEGSSTSTWTQTRTGLYNSVRRILVQKGICSNVLFERQQDRSIKTEAQICVVYDLGDEVASQMDADGKFLVNLADLLSERPCEVSEMQEEEVLRVFARVVGIIKEHITLYWHAAVTPMTMKADDLSIVDFCSSHFWENSAFSAHSATANLLALHYAQRMGEGVSDDMTGARTAGLSTSTERLQVVLGLLLPATRIPWKWIVELDEIDTQDLRVTAEDSQSIIMHCNSV